MSKDRRPPGGTINTISVSTTELSKSDNELNADKTLNNVDLIEEILSLKMQSCDTNIKKLIADNACIKNLSDKI